MRSASAACVVRLRIFFESKSPGNGRTRHRSLSARSEYGPRVEHGRNRARSGTDDGEQSAPATFAAEVAKRQGPRLVQETPRAGRAGDRDFKRAARDAAVSTPWAFESRA